MPIIFKTIGALGMILISTGIVQKNNLRRNYLFVFGGLFLLAYSLYLRDPIFAPLQIIFMGASVYEIYRIQHTKI